MTTSGSESRTTQAGHDGGARLDPRFPGTGPGGTGAHRAPDGP